MQTQTNEADACVICGGPMEHGCNSAACSVECEAQAFRAALGDRAVDVDAVCDGTAEEWMREAARLFPGVEF